VRNQAAGDVVRPISRRSKSKEKKHQQNARHKTNHTANQQHASPSANFTELNKDIVDELIV
jgi:hypothetical protein